MMKIPKIKPIPKYIEKQIIEKDKHYHFAQNITRYYAYLSKTQGNLIKIIVAVKTHKGKHYLKQVVVRSVSGKYCLTKDIAYTYLGGYRVSWNKEGLSKSIKWYESDDWGYCDAKYFNMQIPIINLKYALKFEKYKHSGVIEYKYLDCFKYLKTYEEYPVVEYLVKLNLHNYATSKMIARKLTKDINFRKFIIKNANEIRRNHYYTQTLLSAYTKNQPLQTIQNFLEFGKQQMHHEEYKNIKNFFGDEIFKFLNYLQKQNTKIENYIDYKNACEYLGLDMNEPKNRYPKDFERWHDIRIDQFHTAKIVEDEKAKKEFYEQFGKIASKYLPLERTLIADDYVCIIAKSPKQLIYEGEKLNHCVGRMNYDKKFANEETLIFFVRNRLAPNTPFVTLEYSLKNHKVLQCYARHNTKPDDNVLEFINKKWLPYANRKIKNIAN